MMRCKLFHQFPTHFHQHCKYMFPTYQTFSFFYCSASLKNYFQYTTILKFLILIIFTISLTIYFQYTTILNFLILIIFYLKLYPELVNKGYLMQCINIHVTYLQGWCFTLRTKVLNFVLNSFSCGYQPLRPSRVD